MVVEEVSNKRHRDESEDSDTDVQIKKSRTENLTHNSENDCSFNEPQESRDKTTVDTTKNNSKFSSKDNFNSNDKAETAKEDSEKQNHLLIAAKKLILYDKENIEDEQEKNETENDSINENNSKKFKSRKKKEDIEIVNGVELTVECASDQESDEESIENIPVSRTKTLIVYEKPNDSEVDVSSSEEQKLQENVESKVDLATNLETPKKKRGRKKSSLKAVLPESENDMGSYADDEDYSPISKKKSSPKKSPPKIIESKRGKGRGRGRPKIVRKEISNYETTDEKEEENNINTDKKDKESKKTNLDEIPKKGELNKDVSDEEKSNTESNIVNLKEGKLRKSSQRNIEKIKKLKKYIRTSGLRVKCYDTLLKDCKTDAAKAKRLAQFLEENGIIGKPTLEKCEKFKKKNDALKEAQELDISSIISETRSTRGRNMKKSQAISEVPTSPVQKTRTPLKRLKTVVDSDSE